jgi:putative two-component system response regulator
VASGKGTILVVDDESGIRALLERLLASQGYTVLTASNATDAARIVETSSPDLLLLDVGLPDVDGVTFSRTLRSDPTTDKIPVVLMSASMDVGELQSGVDADAIVRKPFNRDELLTWIHSFVLARRAQVNEAQTEAVLASLAALVEARGLHGERHIWRVADLSARLAFARGLGEDAVGLVRRAGLLHDVGMIAIPEAILRKREALTPAEIAHIQQHSVIGADLCHALPDGAAISAIVRAHHEHWDGTGYPDRLGGEDIPIGARIVALADTFAAATVDRPYRPALTEDQALELIRREAGSKWDPDLVDLFAPIARTEER